MRVPAVLLLALSLAACTLAPPDQPAAPNRMGRFLGLVVSCRCSDIDADTMIAEYPRVLGGRYSEAAVRGMKGYVILGTTEQWDNQGSICAGVCSRHCMVNAVVAPLGGRTTPGIEPCLVGERDLDLEEPEHGNSQ